MKAAPPVEEPSAAASDAAEPVDLGALPSFVGYALRRAQIEVFDDFIQSLAPVDLRPAQFSVLFVIGRNPGLKQSRVSAILGIQRTNFVAMVDELEGRGLLRREAVRHDRRSHALVLTDAGRACLDEAFRLQQQHEARIAARLGSGGRDALLQLLRQLAPAER